MEYHVSKSGNDCFEGTKERPFLTISRAARVAEAGDTVTVHAGIYREWVSPEHGGTEKARIVYQAAGDGEARITGAEPVADWREEGNGVWSAEIENALFSVRNPFAEELFGDWLFEGAFTPHLGDVYLNGKSLYEAESAEKVREPEVWPQAKYPGDSLLVWYAEAGETVTKIWANFGGADPTKENVEISVRPFCFWPEKEGRNYITVKGFVLCQAATQWAPPTALQEGLIGPHWSRGWIIEDNEIRETKCVGVSLGKERGTGQNEWSLRRGKGGTQREQEVIFRALRGNWNKENIGGHIVQNNVIHDCEQAGVVGHLGGAFCRITGNRIYNIHHKRIFHGAEVGGIKLHAALDTEISGNLIYGCYRAVWLDWQAQGTRLCRNVFFDNLSEDLFVEVCHGPYLADHNLFLSRMNFRNMAEGGAFVHNLFAGRFLQAAELTRWTPYHFPHETAVAGYSNIVGGDDRFFNNLFLGDDEPDGEVRPMTFFEHLPLSAGKDGKDRAQVMDGVPEDSVCMLHPVGLGAYHLYPFVMEKQAWEFSEEERKERTEKFGAVYPLKRWALPVKAGGNAYFGGAVPGLQAPPAPERTEELGDCAEAARGGRRADAVFREKGVEVEILPGEGRVHIRIVNPEILQELAVEAVSGEALGKTYHAEAAYENPDGTAVSFATDFFGRERPDGRVTPGPFEQQGDAATEYVIEGFRQKTTNAALCGTFL